VRFAVHGPGYPVASPRSHGVPRRDVPGRVHISVAGETAGSAPEHGLTLTRVPVHLPARRHWLTLIPGRYHQLGRPFEPDLLHAALAATRNLTAASSRPVLLHGDFHRGNVSLP